MQKTRCIKGHIFEGEAYNLQHSVEAHRVDALPIDFEDNLAYPQLSRESSGATYPNRLLDSIR
jgi:hypothetical protein